MAGLMSLALVACGDGGETYGSSGTIAVPPNPTPTATPTPSPSYLTARDFTKDRVVNEFGARIETFRAYSSTSGEEQLVSIGTTTSLAGIGFHYTSATKVYRATYVDDTGKFEEREFSRIRPYDDSVYVGDQDYEPSDPSPSRRYNRIVRKDDNVAQNNMEYVGIVAWYDYTGNEVESGKRGGREVFRLHLYGERTVKSDLPKTGDTPFRLRIESLKSDIELGINWATGEIGGTSRVRCPTEEICPSGDLGEISLVGRFDGSLRILGKIGGSAGYTGTFVGGFYGPRAREIGIVGDLRHVTRQNLIFTSTAKS